MIAAIGGLTATLVKLTTAAFWMLPALLTRRFAMIGVAAAAGVVGLAWTIYAGNVRDANPFAAIVGGKVIGAWFFAGDRLDVETWAEAVTPAFQSVGLLLLPLSVMVLRRPERRFWSWMGISCIGPIVAMTNVFAVHDYYSVALAPAVAALVAGGVDELVRRMPRTRTLVVVTAAVGILVSSSYLVKAFAGGDEADIWATVDEIAATPVGPIVVESDDWSPAPFFYSGREGWAIQRGYSPDPPVGYPVVRRSPLR
jgi:uncharacterized membrane protein YjjB (DUF3815 family)